MHTKQYKEIINPVVNNANTKYLIFIYLYTSSPYYLLVYDDHNDLDINELIYINIKNSYDELTYNMIFNKKENDFYEYSINDTEQGIAKWTEKDIMKDNSRYLTASFNKKEEKEYDIRCHSDEGWVVSDTYNGWTENNTVYKGIYTGRCTTNTWEDVINEWRNGIPYMYPMTITQNFSYNASLEFRNIKTIYSDIVKHIATNDSDSGFSLFFKIFNQPDNQFKLKDIGAKNILLYEIDSSSYLITPNEIDGTDFRNMKKFIDSAKYEVQQLFWITVGKIINLNKNKYKNIKISNSIKYNYFALEVKFS